MHMCKLKQHDTLHQFTYFPESIALEHARSIRNEYQTESNVQRTSDNLLPPDHISINHHQHDPIPITQKECHQTRNLHPSGCVPVTAAKYFPPQIIKVDKHLEQSRNHEPTGDHL